MNEHTTRYEVKASIENYLDHEEMMEWLKKEGFHTIECTKID